MNKNQTKQILNKIFLQFVMRYSKILGGFKDQYPCCTVHIISST